ncbi:MAG TPA: DUF3426 domain-containing protein [Gammaproteobacteria bacterium]|nr:DUF3426 domain-containing protein [Gammaproteobacteria bacterium]
MLTTCTHCHTSFRVTPAQLKAAQGEVRCGKCETVFDAFVSLQAEITPESIAAAQPSPAAEPAFSVEPSTAPELDALLAAGAAAPADTAGLAIGAKAPAAPQIEDMFAGIAAPAVENPAVTTTPLKTEPKAKTKAARKTESKPVVAEKHHFFGALDLHHLHRAAAPPSRWRSLWWSGAVLALLLLGLQLVNGNRDALAQNPVLGPSLQGVYAALGHPLAPPLDVSGWDVGALNVTTDPAAPGALSITGALENRAGFVQPWPALRVVLTDRYGETLRARDFKPAEYLPENQSNVLLAAGQAARFRIDIVDPGADAVGFSILPCLDADGRRVCAAPEHD